MHRSAVRKGDIVKGAVVEPGTHTVDGLVLDTDHETSIGRVNINCQWVQLADESVQVVGFQEVED